MQTIRPHGGHSLVAKDAEETNVSDDREARVSDAEPWNGSGGAKETRALLDALTVPREGTVFDLDPGRWSGMPTLPGHPPFLMTTYRTPHGHRVRPHGGTPPVPDSSHDVGVVTELIVSSAHTGAHIDALCHITVDGRWFGGDAETDLGDAGATTSDAAALPPIIRRGLLLDVAGYLGVETLDAGFRIDSDLVDDVLRAQRLQVEPGDAVLIRTGYMAVWSRDPRAQAAHYGAGPDLSAVQRLADLGAEMIGADTENFECVPDPSGEGFLPAHVELLVNRGIPIGEMLYLEELARVAGDPFLFVCLPLRIFGASGSMVRPVAIV